jgi:hypothetical protein
MAGLRLEGVRDAVGPELAVIIEETGEVLGAWTRDAVLGQGLGIAGEFGRLPVRGVRDGMARGIGPP